VKPLHYSNGYKRDEAKPPLSSSGCASCNKSVYYLPFYVK